MPEITFESNDRQPHEKKLLSATREKSQQVESKFETNAEIPQSEELLSSNDTTVRELGLDAHC